jgi:putative phosphoesterase
MKVAIVADSHDNLDALSYWVDYYNQKNTDRLLHAGDLISPFTVPVLSDFNGTVDAVFGNNDGDRQTLREKAEGTNVRFHEPYSTFRIAQFSIGVAHKPGNLPSTDNTEAGLLVHGHTHERRWSTEGTVPLANPGEVGGWLSGTSSSLFLEVDETLLDHRFNLVPAP